MVRISISRARSASWETGILMTLLLYLRTSILHRIICGMLLSRFQWERLSSTSLSIRMVLLLLGKVIRIDPILFLLDVPDLLRLCRQLGDDLICIEDDIKCNTRASISIVGLT